MNALHWNQRPHAIQLQIAEAFSQVEEGTSSSWGIYNGVEDYNLCGVKEYDLMKRIILEAPSLQKEFYALDIGAGNFQWGKGLASYLNQQTDLPKDIHIHILGIRGEKYLGDRIVTIDRCTLYFLGAFKIEELYSQLSFEFDLIVSRWCFRHLVDPLGTFIQAYQLLRPQSGFFLTDGFFFFYQGQKIDGREGNGNMDQLAFDTHALFLQKFFSCRHSLDHYLFKRTGDLHLPMRYRSLHAVDEKWQIGSERVVEFERDPQPSDDQVFLPTKVDMNLVRGSKAVYDWLKLHGLFTSSSIEWRSYI